ncbi:oligosaccharide flippase family protein [Candidatus Microgenomates bacterium]|nr:oligosaccharide flippase family protein [Candidatus Microgenomates bacterium]
MIKKIISHPLFSGSAIMIGGSMIVNAVSYLYHVIMGRLLGPASYGVLSSVFALLYIVSVVPTSTSVAITKFISSTKSETELKDVYGVIKSFIFKVALVSCVGVLILSPFIQNFLHLNNIFLVILIVPVLYFSLITLVNQATSQGKLKFVGVVGPNLTSALVKLILGVLFVYLGFSVLGALFALMLGAVIAYFYSTIFVKEYLNFKDKHKFKIEKFIKYAVPALLQALAFTSYFTIDIILVKHFLPEFDAGLYAALSTLGKIIYFAVTPIAATMFPIVSSKHSKGEEYKKVFILALFATMATSLAITAFYFLLPNIAIGVLYGAKYLVAKESLVWMGLFMSVYTLCYYLMNFLLSIGKTFAAYWSLAVLVFQIVLILINHNTITSVIQMNLISMILLFLGLSIFLSYNKLTVNGKSNK